MQNRQSCIIIGSINKYFTISADEKLCRTQWIGHEVMLLSDSNLFTVHSALERKEQKTKQNKTKTTQQDQHLLFTFTATNISYYTSLMILYPEFFCNFFSLFTIFIFLFLIVTFRLAHFQGVDYWQKCKGEIKWQPFWFLALGANCFSYALNAEYWSATPPSKNAVSTLAAHYKRRYGPMLYNCPILPFVMGGQCRYCVFTLGGRDTVLAHLHGSLWHNSKYISTLMKQSLGKKFRWL